MSQPEMKQPWTPPEGISPIFGKRVAGEKSGVNIHGKLITQPTESDGAFATFFGPS